MGSALGRVWHRLGDRPLVRFVIVLACVAALLEMTLFNLHHWESLAFPRVDSCEVSLGTGFELQKDGSYKVVDPSTATMTISGFEARACDVHVGLTLVGDGAQSGLDKSAPFLVSVSVADESSSFVLSEVGQRVVYPPVSQSEYMRLHSYGVADEVQLAFGESYSPFTIDDVSLNVVWPFSFDPFRFALVIVAGLLLYLFRPGSAIWRTTFDWADARVRRAATASLVVMVVVTACVCRPNPKGYAVDLSHGSTTSYGWQFDDNQYDYLGKAFASGRLDLDDYVSEASFLRTLANPYDTDLRSDLATATADGIVPDYAWYGGHVYSYFGPLPALVLFAPLHLLTGGDVSTRLMANLLSLVVVVALFRLLVGMARTWFPDRLSLGAFLAAFLALSFGSGLLFVAFCYTTYVIPIACSMIFTFLGLAAWLRALREAGDGGPSRRWLLAGSVLIALNLGCRYSFVATALLAFPLFWDQIAHRRNFFAPSRDAALNTACVVAPFLVLAVPVLLYNAARFGSPTDFGAGYNLTNNDISRRGFDLERLGFGLFSYLFQPSHVNGTFPFMRNVDSANSYLGITSTETIYGGIFLLSPYLLCLFGLGLARREMRARGTFALALAAVALGVALAVLDVEAGGIIQRYQCDFSWLFLLAATLLVWEVLAIPQPERLRRSVQVLLVASVLAGVVLNVMTLFDPNRSANLYWNNQLIYFTVASWFV
ncbi:MAG: hypothetical protein WAY93_07250 [Atopobiaceae bacterium]|jgi:hypothetical protein|nr:hypothetical protein [Atopobiaceae bacterium]